MPQDSIGDVNLLNQSLDDFFLEKDGCFGFSEQLQITEASLIRVQGHGVHPYIDLHVASHLHLVLLLRKDFKLNYASIISYTGKQEDLQFSTAHGGIDLTPYFPAPPKEFLSSHVKFGCLQVIPLALPSIG